MMIFSLRLLQIELNWVLGREHVLLHNRMRQTATFKNVLNNTIYDKWIVSLTKHNYHTCCRLTRNHSSSQTTTTTMYSNILLIRRHTGIHISITFSTKIPHTFQTLYEDARITRPHKCLNFKRERRGKMPNKQYTYRNWENKRCRLCFSI